MTTTEREKMTAGEWCTCIDQELESLRMHARNAVHQHNIMPQAERGNIGPDLAKLFAGVSDNTYIEAPFHCAYGINISLSANVYINTGCVMLDTAPINIGHSTMLGPNVHIYCAEHHKDATKRTAGLEIGKPVNIGERVWIGGGAIIMPGVTIGNGAIVGAGSIVTRDVPSGSTVIGNPARVFERSS